MEETQKVVSDLISCLNEASKDDKALEVYKNAIKEVEQFKEKLKYKSNDLDYKERYLVNLFKGSQYPNEESDLHHYQELVRILKEEKTQLQNQSEHNEAVMLAENKYKTERVQHERLKA